MIPGELPLACRYGAYGADPYAAQNAYSAEYARAYQQQAQPSAAAAQANPVRFIDLIDRFDRLMI